MDRMEANDGRPAFWRKAVMNTNWRVHDVKISRRGDCFRVPVFSSSWIASFISNSVGGTVHWIGGGEKTEPFAESMRFPMVER